MTIPKLNNVLYINAFLIWKDNYKEILNETKI